MSARPNVPPAPARESWITFTSGTHRAQCYYCAAPAADFHHVGPVWIALCPAHAIDRRIPITSPENRK